MPNPRVTYDLIVLGSGPAGQRAAVQAAKLKKKVLVVEKDLIGGSCAHLGTLPSKTLREAALDSTHQNSNLLDSVMRTKRRVIDAETAVLKNQLERNQVEYLQGRASFLSPNEIEIKNAGRASNLQAEKFVIAVGTRPCRSVEHSAGLDGVFDSDSILQLKKLPKSLAVIGAGVIGCEYASIFAKLGVGVTLIDRRAELLRSVDLEIVESLKSHFEANGISLCLGADFRNIKKLSEEVMVEVNAQPRTYSAVLICLGRQGNTEGLGLEKIGVEASPRGIIKVNENYQSNLQHIYAAGDVIGPPALAASSSEQGRLAACHAFGFSGGKFPAFFPYGIYTIPEISSVGLLESEAQSQKLPLVVGRARYRELARGQIIGDEHGLLKLLFNRDNRKLLGVHIIGTGATELVHIGQTALAFDATVDFFVNNVFNYPTLAEAYKVAAYNAMNQFSSF